MISEILRPERILIFLTPGRLVCNLQECFMIRVTLLHITKIFNYSSLIQHYTVQCCGLVAQEYKNTTLTILEVFVIYVQLFHVALSMCANASINVSTRYFELELRKLKFYFNYRVSGELGTILKWWFLMLIYLVHFIMKWATDRSNLISLQPLMTFL